MASPPIRSMNGRFLNNEKQQFSNMDVKFDTLDLLTTTPNVDTVDSTMRSSVIEGCHGSQIVTSSPWPTTQYPGSQEDAISYKVGHMSMFQHQPDLTARNVSSLNPFTYFPSSVPALEYSSSASPIISNFRQFDISDFEEFGDLPQLHGPLDLPSWSDRSSPYPNLPYQDVGTQLSTAAPSSPWDDQLPEDDTVNETAATIPSGIDYDPPYAQWLYDCLIQAPAHQMVLRDIYSWAKINIPKVKESIVSDPNAKGWQNSIRHNLSMNQAFIKVDLLGDGDGKKCTGWKLSETAIQAGGVQSTTRYRKKIVGKAKSHRRINSRGRAHKLRRSSRKGSRGEDLSTTPRSVMSPIPPPVCGNVQPDTMFSLSCTQLMPGLNIERINNVITPPLSGLHYMSSPGLSTLPSLSPSMGSPAQPLHQNRLTSTPQTPMMAFHESSLPDPPLFNQSPSGPFQTNWPDLSWEEDSLSLLT